MYAVKYYQLGLMLERNGELEKNVQEIKKKRGQRRVDCSDLLIFYAFHLHLHSYDCRFHLFIHSR